MRKKKIPTIAPRLRRRGLATLKKLGWGENEILREIDEELWTHAVDYNFGAIWSRPGLSLRDREMICIAVLVALGANGVGAHFRNAHAVGITQREIQEIILQVLPYAGMPKALQAMNIFARVRAGQPTSL